MHIYIFGWPDTGGDPPRIDLILLTYGELLRPHQREVAGEQLPPLCRLFRRVDNIVIVTGRVGVLRCATPRIPRGHRHAADNSVATARPA